jgi:hypothetical protein
MSAALRTRLLGALTAVASALVPVAAQAQVTFDELPQGSFLAIPNPYQGKNWYYVEANGAPTALQYSTLGTRCRSTPNCAYNANGTAAIRIDALTTNEADAFTFSGYLSGGYPGFGTAGHVRAGAGLRRREHDGHFSQLLALPADQSWILANFTTTNVNRIQISSATAQGTATNGYILLDDVTFGARDDHSAGDRGPRAGTVALVATGCWAWRAPPGGGGGWSDRHRDSPAPHAADARVRGVRAYGACRRGTRSGRERRAHEPRPAERRVDADRVLVAVARRDRAGGVRVGAEEVRERGV